MTKRIAINGFGRIGRLVARALFESKRTDIELVAINDLGAAESNAYLLEWDSTHGHFSADIVINEGDLQIDGHRIKIFTERDPSKLPWGDLNVDVVLECTGLFTKKAQAEAHIAGGAKGVLISAPSPDSDLTVVYGVNHQQINKSHTVISNASCTTNCLAPMAKVLHEALGIHHGFMTTIHAFTGDQSLVDTNHSDPRRSRAATESMIPTTTGAARAVGLVLPELKGRLDGTAIRVPTLNVSAVDFTFDANRSTTPAEINELLTNAANTELKGILRAENAPLVSKDFNHTSESCIIDLNQTQVVNDTLCRVLAWYDNEWAFSNRMLDTASLMLKNL